MVSTRLVLVLTGLLAVVGLLSYPRLGSDLFDYVGYERLWVVYHANPLVVAANSYSADWAYPLVTFRDRPPAYGPVWVLITWPLVWLAGASAAGEILAFKLLSLAAYVGCCALIWWNVEPRRRVRALVFFAWSPLVLVDVLGNVHNDVLPALGVLLAVVLAGRARGSHALAAGVACGLVKASALAILPVIVLEHLHHRRWRSLGLGMALALGLVGLAYLPFWAGTDTLRPLLQQTGRVIWSPGSVLIVASGWVPGGPYDSAARALVMLGWTAGCFLLVRRARFGSLADTATNASLLFLLSLLCLTMAFYAHYLVPVVALAALSGNRRLEQLVTALSIGGLAAYGLDQVNDALGPGWFGSPAYQLAGSLISLGPAALLAAVWVAHPRAALPAARLRLGRRG
jgi:hypothetical protein